MKLPVPDTAERRVIRELRDEIHELREEARYLVITPSTAQARDARAARGGGAISSILSPPPPNLGPCTLNPAPTLPLTRRGFRS